MAASSSATLEASLKVREAEADGSLCLICEEPIFLTAHQIVAVMQGKIFGCSNRLVCGSCGEQAIEAFGKFEEGTTRT